MTKKGLGLKGLFAAFCLLASLFFAGAPFCSPVPSTHEVMKGDTLWDLAEFYYGDHSLWPKLWEMNPFITNPHLLKEGDVLRLIEAPLPEVPAPDPFRVEPFPEAVPPPARFDVSLIVDERYAGFFSFEPVVALGKIIADETPRLLLAEGDPVFLELEPELDVSPGDAFMVYRLAGTFADAKEKARRGHAVSLKGRVVVTEELSDGIFKAFIDESVHTVSVEDPLLAAPHIDACLEPSVPGPAVDAAIIAFRHGRELAGRFDVVYLNRGLDEGLKRGSVLYIDRAFARPASRPDKPLPLPPMGSLIVLTVLADSATALVLDAHQEIPVGASLSTVPGEHLESLVSSLPVCNGKEGSRKTLD